MGAYNGDMTRDEEVLAAVSDYWGGFRAVAPSIVARLLNPPFAVSPCVWCPVQPPRHGEKCARVPKDSRYRVDRVLKRLARNGKLTVARFLVGRRAGWASYIKTVEAVEAVEAK